MKICILGKYPPIEGGVSASTYWLAYGLAERGHEVSVVTNADEVEDVYRMHLSAGDEDLYAPVFPASGGSVTVFTTERFGPRMTHIPGHNPFATKLAGLATQTIRSRGCQVIFGYYFEPYALAAYLASSWTGLPWTTRHAGSDIDRLTRIPELGTAYKEVLRAADGVITTSPRMAGRFLAMGVERDRLFRPNPFTPPRAFFHPDAEPLDIGELPHVLAPESSDGASVAFDPSLPTIGIYGKIGIAKGSFDLLRALSILRQEGLRFQFLALTQGAGFSTFVDTVRDLGLSDRTWALPFLPNWRVPSFIRSCTAVCFLERDFPIKIHTPVVASEILAAGGCLVVSGEIARKQGASDAMVDGETVLLVDDPKDHEVLAGKLRQVITDPEEASRIGSRGIALAADRTAFDRYVESYEQILTHAASGEAETPAFAATYRHDTAFTSGDSDADTHGLIRRMPWLAAVLPTEASRFVEAFYENADLTEVDDAIGSGLAFCQFLRGRLETNHIPGDKELIEACLRFQTQRWRAQRDDDQVRTQMPFEATDRLCGALVSSSKARALRPLRSRHAEVVKLEYDVVSLFKRARLAADSDQDVADVADVEKSQTAICFVRTSNLQRTELELTSSVCVLLDLCDGSRSTEEILESLVERRQLPPAELPRYREQVISALQHLYNHRVLVFCNGPRSRVAS